MTIFCTLFLLAAIAMNVRSAEYLKPKHPHFVGPPDDMDWKHPHPLVFQPELTLSPPTFEKSPDHIIKPEKSGHELSRPIGLSHDDRSVMVEKSKKNMIQLRDMLKRGHIHHFHPHSLRIVRLRCSKVVCAKEITALKLQMLAFRKAGFISRHSLKKSFSHVLQCMVKNIEKVSDNCAKIISELNLRNKRNHVQHGTKNNFVNNHAHQLAPRFKRYQHGHKFGEEIDNHFDDSHEDNDSDESPDSESSFENNGDSFHLHHRKHYLRQRHGKQHWGRRKQHEHHQHLWGGRHHHKKFIFHLIGMIALIVGVIIGFLFVARLLSSRNSRNGITTSRRMHVASQREHGSSVPGQPIHYSQVNQNEQGAVIC